MIIKNAEINLLNQVYEQTGNQLVVLYGRADSEKEEILHAFTENKKCFYYRCRQISAEKQQQMMGDEVASQYGVRLQKNTYDEYFNRVKSGNPTKLVVIIDEFQFVMKRDPEFWKSILKLKNKKLYPGPVMIVLSSSSIVWVEQEMGKYMGEDCRKVNQQIKIKDLNFLEVVRKFPAYQVSECVNVYGILGGVWGYLNQWNASLTMKENVCRLVLSKDGYLFDKAQQLILSELREISVYNTILAAIASGHNKLNDLYKETGYSRAKISVYMKNLSHFDIVEKVISFETGGWENAKKGVYQIKDTYVNFWYRFVFPHMSDLYWMKAEDFYDRYMKEELDSYLSRYFRNVCMEYLLLLNQVGRTPIQIEKMGTWVGKSGNIDIIAQNKIRENIVGLCNWEKPVLTIQMCSELFESMTKAKISANHIYFFSAKAFSPELIELAKTDERYELIDMNEL